MTWLLDINIRVVVILLLYIAQHGEGKSSGDGETGAISESRRGQNIRT